MNEIFLIMVYVEWRSINISYLYQNNFVLNSNQILSKSLLHYLYVYVMCVPISYLFIKKKIVRMGLFFY